MQRKKKEIKTIAEGVKKTLISRIEIYKKIYYPPAKWKSQIAQQKITFFKKNIKKKK